MCCSRARVPRDVGGDQTGDGWSNVRGSAQRRKAAATDRVLLAILDLDEIVGRKICSRLSVNALSKFTFPEGQRRYRPDLLKFAAALPFADRSKPV